jgi:hypothetical protein
VVAPVAATVVFGPGPPRRFGCGHHHAPQRSSGACSRGPAGPCGGRRDLPRNGRASGTTPRGGPGSHGPRATCGTPLGVCGRGVQRRTSKACSSRTGVESAPRGCVCWRLSRTPEIPCLRWERGQNGAATREARETNSGGGARVILRSRAEARERRPRWIPTVRRGRVVGENPEAVERQEGNGEPMSRYRTTPDTL